MSTDTQVEVVASRDASVILANKRRKLKNSTVRVGPISHLAEERTALAQRTWTNFTAKQLGVTIGAELAGVDLRADLSDEVIAEIGQALAAYKVIFFRNQPLGPTQHLAFARRFGELEVHPFIPGNQAHPELVRFAKGADAAGYENTWHHDVTWRERPSMGAVLHAIQVPKVGGDTLFADMCAAYDGLDDAMKEKVDGLVAEHDYYLSFGIQVPADRRDEFRAKYPIVQHPLVPTHEVTGRKYLYANRIFLSRIVGMAEAESRELVEELCRQADYPEYQCRFRWEDHSVAFWDNRAVQHYAASDYWPDVRIMERASIVGARPA